MDHNLKNYGSYFVSFLLNEITDLSKIKNIILFGSVARGDSTKESDLDIFIETWNKNKKLSGQASDIAEKFYRTREALLFKSKGIDNKINVIVGRMKDWPKLRNALEGQGIVLYGPYISQNIQGKKQIIISWDRVPINRGALLNKIYGYNLGSKRYSGLLETLNGKKVGKSTIIVPVENAEKIFVLLKKYKVEAKVLEVYA